MIRERIKAGLQRARAQGKRLGRAKVPDDVERRRSRCAGLPRFWNRHLEDGSHARYRHEDGAAEGGDAAELTTTF
jgi:hypothetical protein